MWSLWLAILLIRLLCGPRDIDPAAFYPPDPDFLRAEQTLGFGWRNFLRPAVGGLHVWRVTPAITEDSRLMAMAQIDSVRDLNDSTPDEVAMRGLALACVDRHDEALAALKSGCERWPGCTEFWIMRAITEMESGQWPEAEASLAAASRRAPSLIETRLLQGVCCYHRARANYGADIFRQVVAGRPDWAPGWMSLAAALTFGATSRDEAIRAARKAQELAPDNVDASTSLSWIYRSWKENELSEKAARQALAQFPENPMAWRELFASLGARHRFEEAEAAFAKAMQYTPIIPETLLSRAWYLGEIKGKWEEAAVICRTLVRDWPRFAWGWDKLGAACEKLKKWEEAATAYREGLGVEAKENMKPQKYAGLTRSLSRLDRHREAEGAYRDWIRLEPVRLAPWLGLSNALAAQGNWREAETAARRVLALSAGNHSAKNERYRAWFTLGQICAHLGRNDEARAAYRQALLISPRANEARQALENVGADETR